MHHMPSVAIGRTTVLQLTRLLAVSFQVLHQMITDTRLLILTETCTDSSQAVCEADKSALVEMSGSVIGSIPLEWRLP